MLPRWDPNRLARKLPINVALVGGRRTGKSTACSHLVAMMKAKFDLIIAFIGSAACNPVIHQLMVENWDPRFFFSEWKPDLITKLLKQQEAAAEKRNILILVDDVILSGSAEDQVSHMAMRGRHFGISLMFCAVSYVTLPKQCRRSLDCLLIYSLPMQGDLKVLTWEFATHNSMAEHALRNLDPHCCLVLETLERKQQLFMWKADLLTIVEKSPSPARGRSKNSVSFAIQRERQTGVHQTNTDASHNYTKSREDARGMSPPRHVP